MSLYEWLARRAWQKGDFKLNASGPAWAEPETQEAPEAMRRRLRREMARIVEREAEAFEPGASPKNQGGKMKLAKFVKFREEKFGGVLFETRQEKVYTLNPTGVAIVKEIMAGTQDVAGQLKSKYDCGCKEDCIGPEVDAFLTDLKTKGLIAE